MLYFFVILSLLLWAMGLYVYMVYRSSGVSNISFSGSFTIKLSQNIDINKLLSFPKYLPLKIKEGFNVSDICKDNFA